jgi:ABC-type multidrug transport system ATPase subunit
MATAIEARNLSKKYGSAYGVQDINLQIEEGAVYGFIGPNGAGKTTTISLLTGLIEPTEGEVLLFGKSFQKDALPLKKRIGVVPDSPYLYGYMTAPEYLTFFADLYEKKDSCGKINELLSYFNLSENKDKKLKKYSHGMRQKVNIARALVHDPDILFLDEPISGLDPTGVKEVRDVILEEKKKGKTVFISSHILSEMDKVCDVVGIIRKGRLLMSGSVEKVIGSIKAESSFIIEVDRADPGLVSVVKGIKGVMDVSAEGNTLRIQAAAGQDVRKEVSRKITTKGSLILSMKEEKAGLEEAFVELIKEKS